MFWMWLFICHWLKGEKRRLYDLTDDGDVTTLLYWLARLTLCLLVTFSEEEEEESEEEISFTKNLDKKLQRIHKIKWLTF